MKKAIFAALVVFITIQVSAVELWNGFTTEMNKEQVIAHAKTVLSTSNFEEITSLKFEPFDFRREAGATSGIKF
ncbi:MAG: hypothetical protein LBT68_02340 [Spirochaetales bacterium]|jgi:hypothetical protein|nr:hypothetical protein [Spirochaetales bacterium]